MLDPALVQAFVISLPVAEARRRHVLGCLDGRIRAHLVTAENGRAWTAEEFHRACPDPYCLNHRRQLHPGEVACSVSHRKAMLAFLETRARYGLILEDDATLTPEAIRQLGAVLSTLPAMELLKLCGAGRATIGPGVLHGTADGVTVVRALTLGERAHGYVVSRAGAEKLVRSILPVRAPFDLFWRTAWSHGCEIYESAPWLVGLTEAAEHSTIDAGISHAKISLPFSRVPAYVRFKLGRSLRRRIDGVRRFGIGFLFGRTRIVTGLPSGVAPSGDSPKPA